MTLINIEEYLVHERHPGGSPESTNETLQTLRVMERQAEQPHLQTFTQPFSLPSTSPISHAEMPRSSCELLLTLCVSQEPRWLFFLAPLAAIHSEPSPISLFAPGPFCAVKPPILLASVGFPRTSQNHLMTRSRK
jgi:hypothetical protein